MKYLMMEIGENTVFATADKNQKYFEVTKAAILSDKVGGSV